MKINQDRIESVGIEWFVSKLSIDIGLCYSTGDDIIKAARISDYE